MTDIEILQASYAKYKDKSGRQAKALKFRIDNLIAMNEIFKKALA